MQDNNVVGQIIREMRQARKMSVDALAQAAGIARSTLYNWEGGKVQPRVLELDALLDVLSADDVQRATLLRAMQAPRAEREVQKTNLFAGALPHSGDLLRTIRLRRGWSQRQAAAAVGVEQATLARWEHRTNLPNDERRALLCEVLGAHAEEAAALAAPDLLPSDWPLSPTSRMDFCHEQVDALRQSAESYQSPLIDLYALALKRQIGLLPQGYVSEARRMMVQVEAIYAYWLYMQKRTGEAAEGTRHGLRLMQEISGPPDSFWPTLLNVASCLATKHGDHAPGYRLLQGWLPRFSGSHKAQLVCDMAIYAIFDHKTEESQRLLREAMTTFQKDAPGDDREFEAYYCLTRARVSLEAGEPEETMRWLPIAPAITPATAQLVLVQIATYLELGERREARRLLDGVVASLNAFPVPVLLDKTRNYASRL